MLIEEKINEFLTKLNLTQYTDYLDDSFYVIGLSGLLFLIILFFFVSTSKVKDSNAPKRSTVKPNLDEIIDKAKNNEPLQLDLVSVQMLSHFKKRSCNIHRQKLSCNTRIWGSK